MNFVLSTSIDPQHDLAKFAKKFDAVHPEWRGPPVEGYAVALERRRSSSSGMIQRSSAAATESLVTGFVR